MIRVVILLLFAFWYNVSGPAGTVVCHVCLSIVSSCLMFIVEDESMGMGNEISLFLGYYVISCLNTCSAWGCGHAGWEPDVRTR